MKTGLIFDMDGTLWDSSEGVAASWNEQLLKEGYPEALVTRESIMGVMGLTMDAIARILFAGLPEEKQMRVLEVCCEHENDYLRAHGGTLYPHLEETLLLLSRDWPLFIVSNCQKGYIEAFLDHYDFWKYFQDIECYGNNLLGKGDNIALLSRRNGLEKAIYIGDIQGDYDAAMQAGAQFIHAAYGFGTINVPVPSLSSFDKLPELLRNT